MAGPMGQGVPFPLSGTLGARCRPRVGSLVTALAVPWRERHEMLWHKVLAVGIVARHQTGEVLPMIGLPALAMAMVLAVPGRPPLAMPGPAWSGKL